MTKLAEPQDTRRQRYLLLSALLLSSALSVTLSVARVWYSDTFHYVFLNWNLLLAWAPVGGDLLCLLAGWMRISWWQAALWMAVGKLARYWALAAGVALW